MKKVLFFFFFVYVCVIEAQKFPLDTIQFNGEIANKINIVFLGDGYMTNELDKYIEGVIHITNTLFSQSPFLEYENYFNVFAIRVPSMTSGAATTPDMPINNYFGSTFGFGGIDRLLVPLKMNRVNRVLADNFPEYDQPFMLVNSKTYGGSGGLIATSSTHASSTNIAIHEIGHSMASLADEYWIINQHESPNKTRESNTNRIKWKNWLNTEEVGVIPHNGHPNWFKPHENCKMQFLESDLCAVCRETFIENFYERISIIEGFAPVDQKNARVKNMVTFTIQLQRPDPNHLVKTWRFNDTKILDANLEVMIDLDTLRAGENKLSVRIVDNTPFNRKNKKEEIVEWMINIQDTESRITGTFRTEIPPTITGIDTPNENNTISIFPNPAMEHIDVLIDVGISETLTFKVIDLQGKTHLTRRIKNRKNSYKLPVHQLNKGLYILQVEKDQHFLFEKFIKR